MANKCTRIIENSLGAPQSGLVVQVKVAGLTTVVASTGAGTITDNGDGSYTVTSLGTGRYDWYSGAGSGTIIPSLAGDSHVDPVDVTAMMGQLLFTGGESDAAGWRDVLDLEPGVDVQAYSLTLTAWKSFCDYILGSHLTCFPYYLDGYGWQYPSASAFRTAIGLGTAAVLAYTATGEASKVPQHGSDNTYTLPVRTSHLTANAGNHGKYYRMITSSTEGTYYIGLTGTPATYSVITVEEHAIAGA